MACNCGKKGLKNAQKRRAKNKEKMNVFNRRRGSKEEMKKMIVVKSWKRARDSSGRKSQYHLAFSAVTCLTTKYPSFSPFSPFPLLWIFVEVFLFVVPFSRLR